jgi:hypothetical protein
MLSSTSSLNTLPGAQTSMPASSGQRELLWYGTTDQFSTLLFWIGTLVSVDIWPESHLRLRDHMRHLLRARSSIDTYDKEINEYT